MCISNHKQGLHGDDDIQFKDLHSRGQGPAKQKQLLDLKAKHQEAERALYERAMSMASHPDFLVSFCRMPYARY